MLCDPKVACQRACLVRLWRECVEGGLVDGEESRDSGQRQVVRNATAYNGGAP